MGVCNPELETGGCSHAASAALQEEEEKEEGWGAAGRLDLLSTPHDDVTSRQELPRSLLRGKRLINLTIMDIFILRMLRHFVMVFLPTL